MNAINIFSAPVNWIKMGCADRKYADDLLFDNINIQIMACVFWFTIQWLQLIALQLQLYQI